MIVLDASVLVSYLSPNEIHHKKAVQLYEAVPITTAFLVPSIFAVEVMSAFARRNSPDGQLDALDDLLHTARFCYQPDDNSLIRAASRVARHAKLRAYDAIYGALALTSESPLLSFDDDLIMRLKAGFPKIIVFGR